jgi:beta-glucosidase
MTLNEPQCFVGFGHSSGIGAPGDKLGFAEILRIAHNVLLAHGKSVNTLRARSKGECRIGYAPVGIISMPASRSVRDVSAAREATFRIDGKGVWNNTWWLEPVLKGKYPEDGLKLFAAEMPHIRAGDMETIHQPLDFFGVNIYSGQTVRAGKTGRPETVPPPLGHALTAMRGEVTPDSLYWGPRFFWERYKLPIVMTENGTSCADWVSLDGKVHDPQRIDFLQRYLLSLRRAIADGVDVRGYFQWSLMDNFEWGHGVKERFGLIFLDYPTQKRILKDSALWYKKVIAGNGACLERS